MNPMTNRGLYALFLVICIILPGISLVSADTQGSERLVSDALGRELTIPAEITGVVSTAPPTTMTLYLIAPDLMLGWNSELTPLQKKYIPEQYQSIPVVGGWFGKTDGNFETFIRLNPDIIFEGRTITGDPVDVKAVEERQTQFGAIPLVTIQDTANISGYAKSISLIGDILNRKEKSEALIAYYQTALKTVKDAVSTIPDGEKIKVYYAEGPDGLATDPSGSQHAMLIDYCGGKNVADTTITPGYGMTPVSLEQVLSWNPEVIIAGDSKFASSVLTDPLWKDVLAVQSGRVYGVPVSPFSWFDRPPGTNQIPGLYWMLHTLYPEKFTADQLKEKIYEFYSSFYGIELSDSQLDGLLLDVPVYE